MSNFGIEDYGYDMKYFTFLLIVFGLLLLLFGIFMIYEDTKTSYKMFDGIICEQDIIRGGVFGGATHEFRECSNGKIYINPETYKVIKS